MEKQNRVFHARLVHQELIKPLLNLLVVQIAMLVSIIRLLVQVHAILVPLYAKNFVLRTKLTLELVIL